MGLAGAGAAPAIVTGRRAREGADKFSSAKISSPNQKLVLQSSFPPIQPGRSTARCCSRCGAGAAAGASSSASSSASASNSLSSLSLVQHVSASPARSPRERRRLPVRVGLLGLLRCSSRLAGQPWGQQSHYRLAPMRPAGLSGARSSAPGRCFALNESSAGIRGGVAQHLSSPGKLSSTGAACARGLYRCSRKAAARGAGEGQELPSWAVRLTWRCCCEGPRPAAKSQSVVKHPGKSAPATSGRNKRKMRGWRTTHTTRRVSDSARALALRPVATERRPSDRVVGGGARSSTFRLLVQSSAPFLPPARSPGSAPNPGVLHQQRPAASCRAKVTST